MRDVEGHRHIGSNAERRGDGAASTDLLLHRACAGDIARAIAGSRQLLEHARDDPHAAFVIEGARDAHVLPEALEAHTERDSVAHLHQALDLLGGKAQVDDEVRQGRDLVALACRNEVDGLAADDAT